MDYSWRVYRKNDPNTWPVVDCPMLVYIENYLMLCEWDNECERFNPYNQEACLYCFDLTECYYKYIGYVPDGYKEIKTQKCSCTRRCEYEDDGYCFDKAEGVDRIFCEEVTEYSLNDNKRIWKEFK